MIKAKNSSPKYMRVYSELRRDIDSGRWKPGERLPSEAELVRTFGVSPGRFTREKLDDVSSVMSWSINCPKNTWPTGTVLVRDVFDPPSIGPPAAPIARNTPGGA